MSLAVDQLGSTEDSPRSTPLVLAHGFTQNTRCWGSFARLLAEQHPVTLVDGPGHGRSAHDSVGLWEAGRLLVEAGGTGVYVGYSMGGRMALHGALSEALHGALSEPARVLGLVLIGTTAGIDDRAERAERRRADEALARRLEQEGLEAFLDFWLSLPLFAGLDESVSARSERLTNRPEGLAASLRHCGTGTQEPLWDRLGEIGVPVLLLTGEADDKFTGLARRLAQVWAEAGTAVTVRTLPGTHAIHLEQPEAAAQAVLDWVR